MCPKCKSTRGYLARIKQHGECKITDDGDWEKTLEIDNTEIYGPYKCLECKATFDKLPQN